MTEEPRTQEPRMQELGAHAPVLLQEAVDALAVKEGGFYVDATFGGGGYAREILTRARCRLVGLDRDPEAVARGRELEEMFPENFRMLEGRFGEMELLVGTQLDGVAMDLGVSSYQFDTPERGFSFRFDAPLDMRMGADGPDAADAVNALSEQALADVLYHFGEESEARRIARVLVQERARAPITRTLHLAEMVERAVGGRRGARIHPATQTFQALRILVNDELGELARALGAAESLLRPGGRLAVVSFHSLEDRLVKNFLLERSGLRDGGSRHMPEKTGPDPTFTLAVRKGAPPSEAEVSANPRARSAHLRWAERTRAPALGAATGEALAARAVKEWEALGGTRGRG